MTRFISKKNSRHLREVFFEDALDAFQCKTFGCGIVFNKTNPPEVNEVILGGETAHGGHRRDH